MGKTIKYNRNYNSGSKFDFKNFLCALVCYCFDSFGAMLLLIFSRTKGNRLTTFHAAQAMLSFLVIYFAQLVLSTLGLYRAPFGSIFMLIKAVFVLWGIFSFSFGKYIRVPYISDVASNWC